MNELQQLPCEEHGNTPEAGADFLRTFINTLLLPEDELAVSYMIPFDATDTWIVAAFDQYEDYEVLSDPWTSIIARAPQYHRSAMDSQRRSDADIRKQAQHHPAYTEADILLLPPSRRRRSLSIIQYSLMVCLRRYKAANFKLESTNQRAKKYPPANKREAQHSSHT